MSNGDWYFKKPLDSNSAMPYLANAIEADAAPASEFTYADGSPVDEIADGMVDTLHEAGCIFGGMTCAYWMVAEGCTQGHHPTLHCHRPDDTCPDP